MGLGSEGDKCVSVHGDCYVVVKHGQQFVCGMGLLQIQALTALCSWKESRRFGSLMHPTVWCVGISCAAIYVGTVCSVVVDVLITAVR